MAKFDKIKFVRSYIPSWQKDREKLWYDIIYKSGRIRTCDEDDLPITIRDFFKVAEGRMQYDSGFNRIETIYKERW